MSAPTRHCSIKHAAIGNEIVKGDIIGSAFAKLPGRFPPGVEMMVLKGEKIAHYVPLWLKDVFDIKNRPGCYA